MKLKLPHTITISPDPDQQELLNALRSHFNFKTYSKTILKCAMEYLELLTTHNSLKKQVISQQKTIDKLNLEIASLKEDLMDR